MSTDLKKKTRSAIFWSFLEKGGQQIIYLITAIITARLLPERDFGLVGSLAIFTALAAILLDSGFSIALIREQDVTDKDFNTVFVFNFVVGILIYTILFFISPLIAIFLDNPEIVKIARILFLVIIVNSLGIIQTTILIKQMDFKNLTITNLIAVIFCSIVAVTMALNGLGVWSLVAQIVCMPLIKNIILWIMCKWAPTFRFDKSSFRSLFNYSSKLLAGSIISTISTNIYSFILGGYFQMKTVGHYAKANKMVNTASMSLYNIFGSSTYSMLSNLQDDKERLHRATRKTMSTVAYFTFPVMLGIMLVSRPLIELTIGFRWLPAVPLMQVLCISGLFFVLSSMNGNLIKLCGKTEHIVKLEMITLILMLSFLIIAVRFGIFATVIADAAAKTITYLMYIKTTDKLTDYKWKEQLSDIGQYAVISVIMISLLYPLTFLMDNPFRLLTTQALLGVGFYFCANKFMGSAVQEEIVAAILKKKE